MAGAARIIAADRAAGQLPAATVNGATDAIDAAEVDVVSAVRDLTGASGWIMRSRWWASRSPSAPRTTPPAAAAR
ncbi:hypothetical protein I553_8095 [Mycobacterium xenopi 4042]|uniref:Uncharacterized protein n=1 Tax=Mycobacterium xenopi 4042 TaxID=1299334 RepID=X8DDJ9_MYCXE|nr:hypothetical protein I552_10059 [Mycobacterium xenopi 3993]EUA65773.1 hypothetical protein I553_8095 [Mycobacterium xenopi 4042]